MTYFITIITVWLAIPHTFARGNGGEWEELNNL